MSTMFILQMVSLMGRYIGEEIPRKFDEKIQLAMSAILEDFEFRLVQRLRFASSLSFLFTCLSLASLLSLDRKVIPDYSVLWVILLFGTPALIFILLARTILFIYRFLQNMEMGFKAVIEKTLKESDPSQTLLLKLVQSKTMEELSMIAVGSFTIEILGLMRRKRFHVILSLICFLLSFFMLTFSKF